MLSPHEFYLNTINKSIDMDGAYGAQCWDLFAYFCKLAGYPQFNCTTTGYVKDLWNDRFSSGILQYFEAVSVNSMVDGDWAVWSNCAFAPYSHLAMFRLNNNNGTGVFLGQNQGGIQATTQLNCPYNGLMGALRPKVYINNNANADQILRVGSIVKNKRPFKISAIDVKNNLVASTQLTGVTTKPYHWIPSGPITTVYENGTRHPQQILYIGSYGLLENEYKVLAIDPPTKSVMINVGERNVWIYSKELTEIRDR